MEKEIIIISTDGRVAFPKSEYLGHECRVCLMTGMPELIIWTKTWSGGRIHRYKTIDEAIQQSIGIAKQLNKKSDE